ncbi:unnamed protein product [Somion occarium]
MDSPASSEKSLHQTMLPIDFIVIGGGTSGLCSAISLSRIGHRVTLLEQSDDFEETTGAGGVNIAPNMARLFSRWGLTDRLHEFSVSSHLLHIHRYETGSLIGKHLWQEEVLKELGGEFVSLHYGDLRRVLKDLASEAGAVIRSSARVTSISIGEQGQRPFVTLSSGETLEADVLVGADGISGISRQSVVGQVERPTFTGLATYNAVISEDQIRQHPELVTLFQEEGSFFTWFGHNKSVLTYPLKTRKRGKCIALTMYLPLDDTPPTGWSQSISPEDVVRQLGECDPRILQLISLATSVSYVPIVQMPELASWIDQNNRLVLVGDAAHPVFPGATQATAMGVGDAAALGQVFRHLHHIDQIKSLLKGFEELRQERVGFVAAQEWDYFSITTMPDGEMQTMRDERLRKRHALGLNAFDAEDPDSGDVLNQWEIARKIFGYDAEDEANEWWTKWGSLQERAIFKNITAGWEVEVKHEEESALE